jgi:hypothetical protein
VLLPLSPGHSGKPDCREHESVGGSWHADNSGALYGSNVLSAGTWSGLLRPGSAQLCPSDPCGTVYNTQQPRRARWNALVDEEGRPALLAQVRPAWPSRWRHHEPAPLTVFATALAGCMSTSVPIRRQPWAVRFFDGLRERPRSAVPVVVVQASRARSDSTVWTPGRSFTIFPATYPTVRSPLRAPGLIAPMPARPRQISCATTPFGWRQRCVGVRIALLQNRQIVGCGSCVLLNYHRAPPV